jgi:hypothetical protein
MNSIEPEPSDALEGEQRTPVAAACRQTMHGLIE